MKPGKAHTVDTNQHVPRRYREVEQALEKEKNTNIQLHVQLTNALQELQQVRTERKNIISHSICSSREMLERILENEKGMGCRNLERKTS